MCSIDESVSTADLEAELVGLAGRLAAQHCRFLLLLAEFDRREGLGRTRAEDLRALVVLILLCRFPGWSTTRVEAHTHERLHYPDTLRPKWAGEELDVHHFLDGLLPRLPQPEAA